MVDVIVGVKPKWLDDGPTLVHVREGSQITTLDWLPLVGVWVTVYWTSGDKVLALAVVDALERTGAKLFGAGFGRTVVALTKDRTPEQEQAIRSQWEHLCTA